VAHLVAGDRAFTAYLTLARHLFPALNIRIAGVDNIPKIDRHVK
jgi:hypothetical protein